VLDREGDFDRRCNPRMVDLEPLDGAEDLALVHRLIAQHVDHTGSDLGARVLRDWNESARQFVKIMPRDYKRVLQAEARAAADGRDASFAELVGVGVGG
jgi:glutamate synthase domain-containing protein 3